MVRKHPVQSVAPHKSITELCVELEAALRTPKGSDLSDLYARMYLQHFSRSPRRFDSNRTLKVFKRVQEFCESEDIEPAMWITAQMHGLKNWLRDPQKNRRRVTFMPTMLSGENAKRRYNVYIRMAQARYKRAACDTFDAQTDEGLLLSELTGAEERVGEYYVRETVLGREPTLDDAVEHAIPGLNWVAVFLDVEAKKEFMAFFKHATLLRSRLGADRVAQLKRTVQIRAAFNVTERFAHGLPDRIGLADGVEFRWMALARLLRRLKPEVPAREKAMKLHRTPGFLWGGSYGG